MSGRLPTDNDHYKQRHAELSDLKLHIDSGLEPIGELIANFVEASPWAERRPFVTLYKAGRFEQAREYLERDVLLFDPKNQPKNIKEAMRRLGFDPDRVGDPEDKLRRARAQHQKSNPGSK